MAWFRCMGNPSQPTPPTPEPQENKPLLIFDDGEWKNTDVFDITTSLTGAEDLTIDEDGYLVYGNTTGISMYCKDITKTFSFVAEFVVTNVPVGGYYQTGRCAKGADARRCQAEGYQRYSYHNQGLSDTSFVYFCGNSITNTTQALFLSGNGIKIRRIYGWVGEDFRYGLFSTD